MNWQEMRKIIDKHNEENGITNQFGDKNPLYFVIVYKQSNFEEEFSETERSYRVRSDNKLFLSGMLGRSLFGNCLDGKDMGVRLDWYNWEVERIYQE